MKWQWEIDNPYEIKKDDSGKVISEFHVKSYDLNTGTFESITKKVEPYKKLEPHDYQTKTVSFYWVKPNDNVKVKLKVTGSDGILLDDDEIHVDVLGPTEVKFDNIIQGTENHISIDSNDLSYGVLSTKGIKYDASLRAPLNYPGRIGLIQLINHHEIKVEEIDHVDNKEDKHIVKDFSTKGTYLLDRQPIKDENTNPPTLNTTPMFGNQNQEVSAGSLTTISGSDSPSQLLDTLPNKLDFVKYERVEDFKTYIMWRPDAGETSIWIAVQELTWGWNATTLYKDTDNDNSRDKWFLTNKGVQEKAHRTVNRLLLWNNHLQTETNKYPNDAFIIWTRKKGLFEEGRN